MCGIAIDHLGGRRTFSRDCQTHGLFVALFGRYLHRLAFGHVYYSVDLCDVCVCVAEWRIRSRP